MSSALEKEAAVALLDLATKPKDDSGNIKTPNEDNNSDSYIDTPKVDNTTTISSRTRSSRKKKKKR